MRREVIPKNDDGLKSHGKDAMMKALQKKNLELAKSNAGLTVQTAQLQDALLKSMEERVQEQEGRIRAERRLMEAMSALDVLKVEVGKRIPLLKAVAEHLVDTAGLFNALLCLDYGEILVERIAMKDPLINSVKEAPKLRGIGLSPIPEGEEKKFGLS
jgi:hypothetical protein